MNRIIPREMLRSHLSKFIIRSVQFTKIVETRRDTGAEKFHSGRVKFDPQSSDKNVSLHLPPKNYTFHPLQRFHLSFFFPFPFFLRISPVLLSPSLSPSSSSSASALFCPSRPPPPPPLGTGRNTKRAKPQIYNFAMRIIIEYQKLCYSLFHSAHLLPARRFPPRRQ